MWDDKANSDATWATMGEGKFPTLGPFFDPAHEPKNPFNKDGEMSGYAKMRSVRMESLV